MNTLQLSVALIAVLCNVHNVVDACSCAVQTPEQQFCKSDLVMVVVIGDRHELLSMDAATVYYDFKREELLHASQASKTFFANATMSTRVYTNSNSAACGVDFQDGKEYVIAGMLDGNGKLSVNSCGLNALWSSVKADVKSGLNGGYKCA